MALKSACFRRCLPQKNPPYFSNLQIIQMELDFHPIKKKHDISHYRWCFPMEISSRNDPATSPSPAASWPAPPSAPLAPSPGSEAGRDAGPSRDPGASPGYWGVPLWWWLTNGKLVTINGKTNVLG
jgi:hypothetical protein